MKKFSILGLCALMGLGAVAQEAVIKDAEKAMKGGKDYTEVVTIITPAMSDPATKENVDVYYIPGKAAFNQYAKYEGARALGQLKEDVAARMPEFLLAGYEYYLKALPLDTVVDAKGKVKTTRSKDIVKSMGENHKDLINAGLACFDAKNFKGAYDAWQLYVMLPENPAVVKHMSYVPADSTRADIAYNMALAAFQMEDLQKSLDAFRLAESLGYNNKQLYDYAISVASSLEDQDAVNEFAEKAIPLYGDEDPNYIGYIINGYIYSNDFENALAKINEAIAQKPDNAQYYVIRGILYEQDGIDGDSKAEFKKASELDPQNKMALYHYGRMIYNEALQIYNDAPADAATFNKIFNEDFKPLMLQAVDLLEGAYALDQDYADPLKLLQQAYYLLNDDAKMKDTETRLKYL